MRGREKGKNVHWKHNSDHAELLRETTVSAKEEEGRKLERREDGERGEGIHRGPKVLSRHYNNR